MARADRRFWTRCTVLVGLILFCYAGVLAELTSVWWNNSVYSHGFLVPFISLYLVWLRRDRLRDITPEPGYLSGALVLATGLSALVAGAFAGVSVVEETSIMVTVSGIVLIVLGRRFLSALLFPIAYLAFMMRFWEVFTIKLHPVFQNFSAALGTDLLHLVGIPAYRQTIYIELPNITLKVAEVCSGVNYLIAVMAIGVPLAYISLRGWTRRVVLVSGALIIAILANVLRVALIGTLAYYNLAGNLHGPHHVLQGMFISFIGFIALFAGAGLLSRGESAAHEAEGARDAGPGGRHKSISSAPLLLAAGMLLAAGTVVNFHHPSPVPLKKDLSSFPLVIGGWTGADVEPDKTLEREFGSDKSLLRVYTKAAESVELFIGYDEYQEQGKELVNYLTARHHGGAEEAEISLGGGDTVTVNRTTREEGALTRTTLFWYVINGRVVTGRTTAKMYTAIDSLLRGRSNGAVVMVSRGHGDSLPAPSPGEERDFVKELVTVLKEYLP